MPPANVWPVERNGGTSNWRPHTPLHLPLLLRLSKAVRGEAGGEIGAVGGLSFSYNDRAGVPKYGVPHLPYHRGGPRGITDLFTIFRTVGLVHPRSSKTHRVPESSVWGTG